MLAFCFSTSLYLNSCIKKSLTYYNYIVMNDNDVPLSLLIKLVTGRSDKSKLKQIDLDSLQMMYITITDKIS
jgi:hypothetical protein